MSHYGHNNGAGGFNFPSLFPNLAPGQQPPQPQPPAHSMYPGMGGGAPLPGGYPSGSPSQPGFMPPSQPSYYNPPPPQQPGFPGYPPSMPPSQPGYPSAPPSHYAQQPGGAYYPSQPSYQPTPVPGAGYGGGYRQPSNTLFDARSYFRTMFDDIDLNRNGHLTIDELHEALRRGQSNAQFDQRTVAILMEKYDKNRNGQIQFDEFYDLFAGINQQFNDFLDMDRDSSGFIDGRELTAALHRRGFTDLSPDLFNYIVYELSRRNGVSGINFDLYVRTIARLDYLRAQYYRNPYNSVPFDQFVRQSFF